MIAARARLAAARGQRAAEALMIDTCKVTRPTGELVTNPDTGVDEPTFIQVYPTPEQVAAGQRGRCKVQTTVAQAASPEAGEHQFTVENLQLHVPVTALLQTGDQAVITASFMPQFVGLELQLVELERKTYATANRWNVKLVTS